MKKYRFLKAICLSCIVFFAISCTNEDYFIEATKSKLAQTRSIETDTTTFVAILNIYANSFKDYIFNYSTPEAYRIDQCFVWIDDHYDYFRPLGGLLKNDEYVWSYFDLTYGTHHVKVKVLIDEGRYYGIKKCRMVVASQCTGLGTIFFDETVDRIEPGGSLSNADFEAEFDVDYPYVPEHEYALDIELFFEE